MRTTTPRKPASTPKSAREWWIASILLVAIVVATVVIAAVSKSHLPDPLGTHFSGVAASAPDGFSSRTGSLIVIPAIVAAVCVVTWIAWFTSPSFAVRRWALAAGAGVALLIVSALVSIIIANYGLTDAHDARSGVVGALWPIIVTAVIVALTVVAYGRLPKRERGLVALDDDRPIMEISATERVSWSRRGHSDLLIAVGLAVTLIPLALVFAGVHASLLIAVIAGVVALQFAFYNVRITNDRIVVRSGLIPIPTFSFDMSDVDHADYADKISPLQYHGWGLRVRPNGRALILNSGPALLIYMTNGNEHVVTMAGSREAAGVINGVLRQGERRAS